MFGFHRVLPSFEGLWGFWGSRGYKGALGALRGFGPSCRGLGLGVFWGGGGLGIRRFQGFKCFCSGRSFGRFLDG